MGSIKLAANLISNTEGWANWGHLQIVNSSTGQEIEVQSPVNMLPNDPNNIPNFLYRPVQSHSGHTDFAPGSGTYDPDKYKSVDVDIGDRDAAEFWNVLQQVNQSFLDQTPNYLYGLGQNSNSYAMTLLWMMGIDTSGLLSAVKPAAVTGMTEESADEEFGTGWSLDVLDPFPGADRNLLLNGYNGFLGLPTVDFVDINLTTGNDIFRTGHGDDRIFGNAGDDSIESNGGSDTLSGGSGNDQLFGGGGFDFADYSGGGEQAQTQPAQGIRAAFTINGEDELVGTVTDSWGDTDQLSGIEFLIGTNQDDRVRIIGNASDIFWSSNTQLEADARGNTALGDVLDFSGLSGSPGLEITWDAEGITEIGQAGFVGHMTVDNFENIIGSIGADTITGDDQANGINGHLGADILFGGGGDDFIFFDAADGPNVDGGADWDVAVALGNDGVTVDMTGQSLECVIGCDGADVITVGSGNGNLMAAGGAGSDTFYVSYGEGQDTRIIWASDDAESDDIFIYNSGEPGSQLGILVVTVAGLTRENFSSFDLSMLNLPTSFNWGAIDAVIINPDSRDNYYAGFDTSPMAVQFVGTISMDENLTPLEYETVADVTISQAVQGTSSALGADLHMQTEGSGWEYVEIWYREKGTTSTAWLNWGEWYDQGIEDTIEELTDEYGDPIAEWSIDMGGFQGGGDATGMSWFRDSQWTGGPNGWWFVAGGAMYGEDLVAVGAPHAIMPNNPDPSPFDWLLAA